MIDYTLPLDQLPDPLPIEPLRKPFDVTITPPGSKSITCRAYVLAALHSGWVVNPLRSDDTDDLERALTVLGAQFVAHADSPHEVHVEGVAGRFPRGGVIRMREGGAPTRFLIACACLASECVVIDASERMRERPVAEGVDLLRGLGASIDYVDRDGRLPVRVDPSPGMQGGTVTIGRSLSSQFISAAMLIGSALPKGLEIQIAEPVTSEAYVNLTTSVMRHAGVEVVHDRTSIRVEPFHNRANRIIVEPDATSATYWLAAAAIAYSGRVRICLPRTTGESFTAWQGDWQFSSIIARMGAIVHPQRGLYLSVRADGALRAVDADMSNMPDAALTLAMLCSVAYGHSRLTGLQTLRVKETDRIAALANELRKVGCGVETGEDWIEITPPPRAHAGADDLRGGREEAPDRPQRRARSGPSSLRSSGPAWVAQEETPIIIETYNDHRMAMAFAVLGLNPPRGVPLAIRNPKCVAKSYPTFWKDFAKLYR